MNEILNKKVFNEETLCITKYFVALSLQALFVKRPAVNLYGGLVGQKQWNLKGLGI
jgi:hypothetical protein